MPLRPPFTGIHEILPTQGDPGAHEGGGPLRPYGEDLFQRIVDVNWGDRSGGIFVFGDFCCYNFYVKVIVDSMSKSFKVDSVQALGTMSFGPGGSTLAASYGQTQGYQPTFVLGGHGGGFGGPVIMYSYDGLKWDNSFLFGSEFLYKPNANVIVWSKKYQRFLAEILIAIDTPMTLMGSHDGHYWLVVGPIGGSNDLLSYSQFGLPDGQWGYSQRTGEFKTAAEMDAGALTYAGGVWARGIHNRVEVSFDETETWIDVGVNAPYSITTGIGGPLSHFQRGMFTLAQG